MNAKVMVLGTFHFYFDGYDIQSDARQAEILDLAEKIAGFKPDKILVERGPAKQEQLDARYQQYLTDGVVDIHKTHSPDDIHEIVMLGFPIAKTCGLNKLYGIDHMIPWIQGEAVNYAKENCADLMEEIRVKGREFSQYARELKSKSMLDIHREENSDEAIRQRHSDLFLIFNQIGAFDNYVGSKFLTSWYERNLKIFANIQALCKDGERVLVLIEAGHLATLTSMVKDYYKMDFVSPLTYLQ